jgi:hypothetical protein
MSKIESKIKINDNESKCNDIMREFLIIHREEVSQMIFDDTTYEKEILEKGVKKGQRATRFEMAKELVSIKKWSLAEAADFARLNKTEAKKLANAFPSSN